MDTMRLISPAEEARILLDQCDLKTAPIDVKKICAKLRIGCYYTDLSEIEAAAGRKIDGVIQRNKEGKFNILVNEDAPETRRRFTIAHELGHYFLHMKDADPGMVITSFRGDRSRQETEANSFAAELLMPEALVHSEYKKLVIPVVASLAKRFNVSVQAMGIRLDRLDLMYV